MRKKIIYFLLIIFCLFSVFSEKYTVPFSNLPKISKDKKIEFVKVLDKKYNNLPNGIVNIDYIFWISKTSVDNIIVQDINNKFIFYINDDGFGRQITEKEKESIFVFIKKDSDGNFIIELKNISNKVFRLDVEISILFKDIQVSTVLEFFDYDVFPTKFLNKSLFFDKKDISIGKFTIIEK